MTSRTFLGKEYMENRSSFAGPSILEMLEHEARRLAGIKNPSDYEQGQLHGMRDAISVMRQPYEWLAKHPQTRPAVSDH